MRYIAFSKGIGRLNAIVVYLSIGQLRTHQLLLRAYRPDFVLDLVVYWCKIVVSTVTCPREDHFTSHFNTYVMCGGAPRHAAPPRQPRSNPPNQPYLASSRLSLPHTHTMGRPSTSRGCSGSTSTAHLPPTSSLQTPPARRGAARRRLHRRCFRRHVA